MKKYLFLSVFILFYFTVFSEVCRAITVTASPSPAVVNQTVTVTVDSSYAIGPAAPSCTLAVNFGDGSPWQALSPCTATPCTRTITHTFTTPGNYIITARSRANSCSTPPTGPDPATTSLTVRCTALAISSPASLPRGISGTAYSDTLQASGGQAPYTWAVTGGSLPPGISLDASGQISGTPATAGTYNFTVSVTDSCPTGTQQVQQGFSLVIGGNLRVTVSPGRSRIPRNTVSTRRIAYNFTSDAAGPMRLTSDRGTFTADGRNIGESPAPLTVEVVNGTGMISENLTIPAAVSLRAEEVGTPRIIYSRTFTGGPRPVTARTELILGTEATAEFSINRLQLYFENQRAEITVSRNTPDLKAFVDIRFSGSGLLTGYWEVDGRLLEHVKQHLVYGRSITLATPDVPPLPTFSPGTHIARFVVTHPSADIPIPQALYFVTAEASEEVRFIELNAPDDQSQIPYKPVRFKWQPVKWAETYLIAFFEKTDEIPIFSAYTRESTYQLPAVILNSLFAKDKKYRWRVKGYNADGNALGESAVYEVAFAE